MSGQKCRYCKAVGRVCTRYTYMLPMGVVMDTLLCDGCKKKFNLRGKHCVVCREKVESMEDGFGFMNGKMFDEGIRIDYVVMLCCSQKCFSETKSNMAVFNKAYSKVSGLPLVKVCKVCNKVGESMKKCGKCEGAAYCGVECQREDWPRHKERCSN